MTNPTKKTYEARLVVDKVNGVAGQRFGFGRSFFGEDDQTGVKTYIPNKVVEGFNMAVAGGYHVLVAENARPERVNTPLFVLRVFGITGASITEEHKAAIHNELEFAGVASTREINDAVPDLDFGTTHNAMRYLWRDGECQRIVRIPKAGAGPEEEMWASNDFLLTDLLDD